MPRNWRRGMTWWERRRQRRVRGDEACEEGEGGADDAKDVETNGVEEEEGGIG